MEIEEETDAEAAWSDREVLSENDENEEEQNPFMQTIETEMGARHVFEPRTGKNHKDSKSKAEDFNGSHSQVRCKKQRHPHAFL